MEYVKCVAVGDTNSGKTILFITYTYNRYPGEFIPTKFDNYSANIFADGLPPVTLQVWDTPGQEDHKNLTQLCYPETDILMLCFSLVHPTTLESIENHWVKEIREFCPNKPMILVGTHSYIRDELYKDKNFKWNGETLMHYGCKPIPYYKGKAMAKRINACAYIECDAFKKENLEEVFETAARFAINPPDHDEKGSSCCCEVF